MLCGFVSVGNGKIFVESPEMIDPEHVIQAETVGDPLHPPVIPGISVHLPVIERIPPELSGSGKSVRRASGHLRGAVVLIQLEQPGIRPGIRAVHSHIDRDIPDDTDSLLIGIGLQLRPLLAEFKLHIFIKLDLKIEFPAVIIQGVLPAQADIFRPLAPGLSVKAVLHRHEKGVVLQPPGLFFLKSQEFRILSDIAALVGFAQKGHPAFVHFGVVHADRILPEIRPVAFSLCQHSLLDQILQTDKIRIPRKGGKRLVWRISVTGGTQRQNLPVALSRRFQGVHKLIRASGKTSDSIFRRQAAHREQHAALSPVSHIVSPSVLYFRIRFR